MIDEKRRLRAPFFFARCPERRRLRLDADFHSTNDVPISGKLVGGYGFEPQTLSV
jgi:hypothetical protein